MDAKMYKVALLILWKCFDIPIDGLEQIEEPFLHFPTGTNRFEVWRWFDNMSPNGLVELTKKQQCRSTKRLWDEYREYEKSADLPIMNFTEWLDSKTTND